MATDDSDSAQRSRDEGSESERLPDTVEQLIKERSGELVGGWRGAAEAALPIVGFVTTWTITSDLTTSLMVAAAFVLVVGVVRLITDGFQWSTVRFTGTGILGVALAAFFALRSGRAEDAFLPSILISLAYGSGTLLSIIVRWPLAGFVVGMLSRDEALFPTGWRRHAGMVSVATRLTWLLFASYAIRVAILAPLYFAGRVVELGVAKIVTGTPLSVGLVLLASALILNGHTPIDDGADGIDDEPVVSKAVPEKP